MITENDFSIDFDCEQNNLSNMGPRLAKDVNLFHYCSLYVIGDINHFILQYIMFMALVFYFIRLFLFYIWTKLFIQQMIPNYNPLFIVFLHAILKIKLLLICVGNVCL